MDMLEVSTPPGEHISQLGGGVPDKTDAPQSASNKIMEEKARNLNRCLTALEHPTVKVPYEVLNRKFRSAQKVLEREVVAVSACVSEVKAALTASPQPPPQELTSLIRGVITQVSTLKRKAKEAMTGELDCARVVKRRVEHLQEASHHQPATRNAWERTRFDRLLTDYLLREGCYDTAKKLVETSSIESLTNLEIFQTAYEVEKCLRARDVTKCLAWCQENKSKLKRLSSNLEFNLRMQEFIEMIKKDERMSAVWHARKYFNTQDPEQLDAVKPCMALLAFPVNINIAEYQTLLSDGRWDSLIVQFRAENLRIFQLSPQASFNIVLQAGLSALKTPQCYKSNKDSYNPDCPVCLPHLNVLARDLPYAHCGQSRLLCQLSGERMNEHNQPLMLPNGYVYGTNALEAMAAQNNGEVRCPRTNTKFQMSEARKVYVM